MTVDSKAAKHICNVIQRQLRDSYRYLNIEFISHKEDEREKAFTNAKCKIARQKCGASIIDHITNSKHLLKKNNSELVAIARSKSFLSQKGKYYLALCFINLDDFENENHLRNDALNLTYQAIELYSDFLSDKTNGKNSKCYVKGKIIAPKLNQHEICLRNLRADIFSCISQTLQGRAKTLETLSKQRMVDTLSPKLHFPAENFPFPICIDTLSFFYEHNIDQYRKNKDPIIAAVKAAKEIGLTYEIASIERWKSFSIPAQEMAWIGSDPTLIIGSALYTSENTYVQSISNIFSDKLNIAPEMMDIYQDYNPFTSQEVNEHIHKKQCNELFRNLQDKIRNQADYHMLSDIAKKQNQMLLNSSIMGWCASALIQASDIIKQSSEDDNISTVVDAARNAFNKEVDSIPWDTLAHFSLMLLKNRRNNVNDIKITAKINDEFSSIYNSIIFTDSYKYAIKPPPMMRG